MNMLLKRLRRVVFALMCMCASTNLAGAQSSQGNVMNETHYPYLEEASRLCRENDIQGLEQMTDALIEKASYETEQIPVSMVNALCAEIANSSLRNESGKRKRLMVRRLASMALKETDPSDFRSKLSILDAYLRVDAANQSYTTNDWPSMRRLSAQQWLSTWIDLEHQIDDKWALEAPENSVRPYIPPESIPFVSGMSPDGIKDPEIRAEYESHLEKNRVVSERNRRQQELRKLKAKYAPVIEAYLVGLYSESPANRQELNELLSNVADETFRKNIQDVLTH